MESQLLNKFTSFLPQNRSKNNKIPIATVTYTESGTPMLNWDTVDIFAISQLKWLKFCLQAHFLKMFEHAKFQLSISCTFHHYETFSGNH